MEFPETQELIDTEEELLEFVYMQDLPEKERLRVCRMIRRTFNMWQELVRLRRENVELQQGRTDGASGGNTRSQDQQGR